MELKTKPEAAGMAAFWLLHGSTDDNNAVLHSNSAYPHDDNV